MMTKKFREGQSIVEYTILIIIVATALAAMSIYITRSVNARLKTAQDELNNSGIGGAGVGVGVGGSGGTGTGGTGTGGTSTGGTGSAGGGGGGGGGGGW